MYHDINQVVNIEISILILPIFTTNTFYMVYSVPLRMVSPPPKEFEIPIYSQLNPCNKTPLRKHISRSTF